MSGGALCRDCGWRAPTASPPSRCRACRSPRLLAHDELFSLSIAHVDCDAFYASVEKRDRPELHDKPLIVGGGERGVVTTACYLARIHGVRSAMPMVQAKALCPDAVVLPPEMGKYAEASRQIRDLFESLTPLVEPLSLDEAFLDLSGTERLHGMPPAAALAKLAARIEAEVGVTASVGLSWNKFLAKIASDLDKPRGFSVIGRAETLDFLENKPVKTIWGVGAAMEARLVADGYRTIGDLRRADEATLARAYGAMGQRLARLSRGRDARSVSRGGAAKSVSAETTFDRDLDPATAADRETLDGVLWRLSEKVSARMKKAALAGRVVTLTLKTARHKRLTRRRSLTAATALADALYRTASALLEAELSKPESTRMRYRLAGVGFSGLEKAPIDGDAGEEAAPSQIGAQTGFEALLDPKTAQNEQVERTVDDLRRRFGHNVVQKGRGFRRPHNG